MGIKLPGLGWSIGKTKKSNKEKKKDVLDQAYKKVLASGAGDSKVEWPQMFGGAPIWYDEEQGDLRKATAAGMMSDAERMTPGAPRNWKLNFDMTDSVTGKTAEHAFSSSEGLVNMPTDLKGYMSKPQYLAAVLAHEVAHNADWAQNKPKVGHNKETFRPLEKAASRSAQLEPQYNPGDDVDIGGANEYPDRYAQLGPWTDKYRLSANEMDPTQQTFPIDARALAREILNRRSMTRSGPIRGGGQVNLGGPNRGFRI